MKEFKAGTLHSGSAKGPKVTSRKQAIAIGLSSQRKEMGDRMARMSGGGAKSQKGTSKTMGSMA